MTLCKNSSLVKFGRHEVEAVSLKCHSWTCEICAQDRKKLLIAECLAGSAQRFVTLTWKPRNSCNASQARSQLSLAWAKIVKRLRLSKNGTRLEYFAVTELTKAGWPHLHILTRGPYISQKWLSAAMREYCDSPIVDVRRISSQKMAANYVSKYVGKAPARIGASKRYYKSQGWLIDWKPLDKARKIAGGVFELVGCDIGSFKRLCENAAYYIEDCSASYLYARAGP